MTKKMKKQCVAVEKKNIIVDKQKIIQSILNKTGPQPKIVLKKIQLESKNPRKCLSSLK